MQLHDFCQEMGFDRAVECKLFEHWPALWENSSDELPFFMERTFYERHYPLCGGPSGVLERMAEVARITAEHPVCCRYAAMLYYGHFAAAPAIAMDYFPLPEKFYGENAGIFQLMVAVASLPLIAQTHRRMGLPAHFLADAATWIGGTIGTYAAAHQGIPGHTLGQTYWLRLHIDGELFRIGRLEYLLGSWLDCLPAVYVNDAGMIKVLCRDRWQYDSEGRRFDPGPEEPAFTARLEIGPERIVGTPVRADGTPDREKTEVLERSDWHELCAPWELIPSIHIPGGGGMDWASVKRSMLEAREFFRNYFHTEVKAFVCNSWIFNPVWQRELPDSNLAEFQRRVHLCAAHKSAYRHGLFFVYGDADCDPRERPCTTRLHRVFRQLFDRGEPLTVGAMFILNHELDQ